MFNKRSAVLMVLLTNAMPIAAGDGQAIGTDRQMQDAVFVFLDCNAPRCDADHFRREITWVNWVRDRRDADVHLLVTAEGTGGGGLRYTLDYVGQRAFEQQTTSMEYVADANNTDAETRDGLVRRIALGLVHYASRTSAAARLRVRYEETESPAVTREEHDPWNLWVFRLSASGSVEGESKERSYSAHASTSASRIDDEIKFSLRLSGSYSRSEFDIDDTTQVVSTFEDVTGSLLMVGSIGSHWAAGFRALANRSTFLNRDLAVAFGPALEFDIFPYDESTRRQIVIRYLPEMVVFDYELETVENEQFEILPRHSLIIAAEVQQPWGEIDLSVEGIQYLHDLAAHRVDTFGSLEYRLFRGFSVSLYGGFSRIKDQFFLPKEGLTPEEILLQRRQRETDFRFDVGVGFSYRFGSKFANIVNPRMGGGFAFFGL